jgi:putative MATE family efflux protein
MSTLDPTPRVRLVPVVAPLLAELALAVGVAAVGLALAARLGDDEASAYLLTQHLLAALTLLLRIVGAGVGVVVAQALGQGQRAHADAVARSTLGAATWVSVAIVLVMLVASPWMWHAMQAPESLRPAATAFLCVMAPAVLLDAWASALSGVLRAHLQGAAVLRVLCSLHGVHLVLAPVAMLSWGSWPGLGLAGFALALGLARLVGVCLLWRLWTRQLQIHLGWRDWLQWRHSSLRGVIRIGWPSAAEAALYRLSFLISVAAAGSLGSAALAAQGYALQINHLTLLFALALGLGTEIVTGHRIGAGHWHEADAGVRRALSMGVLGSTALAMAAAAAGPWLLGVFTADPAALAAAGALLWWSVLLEPGRAFNLVLVNALRATGDSRFPLWAALVSMPLLLGLGAWWLAIEQGMGLSGLWLAYAADEWVRGLAMWLRWRARAWIPSARQARREARMPVATANRVSPAP